MFRDAGARNNKKIMCSPISDKDTREVRQPHICFLSRRQLCSEKSGCSYSSTNKTATKSDQNEIAKYV